MNPQGDKFLRGKYPMNTRYFSGSQASIFIGDIWVDDINAITYTVSHNRVPIYGYGSQHFDFMPKGNILVNGAFTINFREPNYLWMIIRRFTAFHLGQQQDKRNVNPAYDRSIRNPDINTVLSGEQQRKNLDFFFQTGDPAVAQENKEILQTSLSGARQFTPVRENFNHSGFSITMGYGEELNAGTVAEQIHNVFIVGKGKQVQIDGRPIQEEYTFMARMIT